MDWRITPQRLSCVLLLAFATLPLAAITPAPTAKTCDSVMQWARDNRDSLPRDYRSLLAYPLDQRRAIYSQMTGAEKATFWSDRIDIYLVEHAELTAGQLRAVAEAKDFLKAEKLGAQPSVLLEQDLTVFADRMNAGLGDKVARELLYGLGPEAPGQSVSLGGVPCECRIDNDCVSPERCEFPTTPPCTPTETGCGIGGTRPCIGLCNIPGTDGK